MDLIHNLGLGFEVALSLQNVAYALFGAILGTLIGVLPGVGAVATIAMLMPSIVALDATPALIMLAAICCGAQYGSSTAAILINVPGEAGSVVTCIDGCQMARHGRAGSALAVAALGSFFAGCVGTAVIAAFAAPLGQIALGFGPTEYFSLIVLGLTGAVVLASGSLLKAIAMAILGLLLAQVGTDAISGVPRFGFGVPALSHGIGFAVIAIGIFGLGAIVANLGRPAGHREVLAREVARPWPTRQDFADSWPAAVRGTALGSLLGMLPGGGARLASFASYTLEKNSHRRPGEPDFGQGNIRGVAGPESANNAGAQTSFIPMLALGIPPNAAMALMVGALTLEGIQPGPQAMSSNPQLFWGLIASMWVGNAMLVVLNLPLIGIWIRLLAVPYRFVFPAIVAFCTIGCWTLNHGSFDVFVAAVFCLVGYALYKLGCEPAPLLLGFILGPMMEHNLRRALLLSRGDWTTFTSRPLSAALLAAAAVLILVVTLRSLRGKRRAAFQQG